MPWSTPRTWVTGEVVTAVMWAGTFANLRATAPALMTTAEDLIQGSGVSGSPCQRLAVGTSTQCVTAGASLVTWAATPAAVGTASATVSDQTSPAGSWDQWGTEEAEFASTSGSVVVIGWLTGFPDSGTTNDNCGARVAISVGGSWQYSADNQYSDDQYGHPQWYFYRYAGTVSGTVGIRAEHKAASYNEWFYGGRLAGLMYGGT